MIAFVMRDDDPSMNQSQMTNRILPSIVIPSFFVVATVFHRRDARIKGRRTLWSSPVGRALRRAVRERATSMAGEITDRFWEIEARLG